MGGSLGGEVSKRGVPGRWGAATPHEPVSVGAAMLQQMQPNQMPHRCISCNAAITVQVRRHLARRLRSQTTTTESPIPLWHPNHDKCRMMHSMQFRALWNTSVAWNGTDAVATASLA